MESQLSGSWQDWVGVAGYVLFAGFIVWRVLNNAIKMSYSAMCWVVAC
ncbi:hypothetical protein [Okeania sp. SIO2B3]|nr:hypothetical protein [Okeania sp. SIO2B3]